MLEGRAIFVHVVLQHLVFSAFSSVLWCVYVQHFSN